MAKGKERHQKHLPSRKTNSHNMSINLNGNQCKPSLDQEDLAEKGDSMSVEMLMIRAVNCFGVLFFLLVGFVSFAIPMFYTIPVLVEKLGFIGWKHRSFAVYSFVANMGHFMLARYTDTSLKSIQTCPKEPRASEDQSHNLPFRAHPCRLCKAVILKHDHHCFLLGRCVGYYNQKHFIWLSCHVTIAAFYCLFQTALYLSLVYHVRFPGGWTYFVILPRAAIGWFSGSICHMELVLTAYLHLCLGGGLIALGFSIWELLVVVLGKTPHEVINGQKKRLKPKSNLVNNWKDVFGKYWLLGMFLPIPLPQYGNGLYKTVGR